MCDAPDLCEIGQGRHTIRSNGSNRVSEKAAAEGGGSQAIHGHPGYIMCDTPALYEIGQGRRTIRSNRVSEKATAEGEALKRSTDIPGTSCATPLPYAR